MFVYEIKGKIGITFKDDAPVDFPEYLIEVDKENQKVTLNGQSISPMQVITLSEDVEYETSTEINAPVAIQLNGNNISIPNDVNGDGVYRVVKGGYLTISGEGTINGVGKNEYNMAIWADGGKVVINGGTFTNKGAVGNDNSHFDLIYVKDGGEVEINGGTFICETPKWTLNSNDTKPGKIIVKGGTFYKYNPSNSYTEPTSDGGPVSFVPDGYKVVEDGDYFTVVRV